MTAAATALVLAMLLQLAWTFAVMVWTARVRFAAARAKRVTGNIALDHRAWPDDVLKVSNNMNNQFETPTLFYALVLLALVLGLADWVLVVLAFAYVASRVVHTAIHTGSNRIVQRFQVFLVGVGCLMLMTAWVSVRLVAG
ncbi:MAPEG family protein [Chthonobacter rhizosphaerae]|uniref:MAPEG family protein n=1 Tax=Chthonobacter rhizosphaerae TaxID=2735553 RepID=UPI0015EFC186|nr:MAPEG family protein [Chthonobacter rhizosphaerae]